MVICNSGSSLKAQAIHYMEDKLMPSRSDFALGIHYRRDEINNVYLKFYTEAGNKECRYKFSIFARLRNVGLCAHTLQRTTENIDSKIEYMFFFSTSNSHVCCQASCHKYHILGRIIASGYCSISLIDMASF